MTTNKTPIQELIDLLNKRGDELWETLGTESYVARCHLFDCRELAKTLLQKEKAFAFDCFEAGKLYGIDLCLSIEDVVETREPKFDEFYSKYAEQHAD